MRPAPKGRRLGFIKIIDERSLLTADPGRRCKRLFQSFESNPEAGVVFMTPGIEVTVRVNGRVRVVEAPELETLGMSRRCSGRATTRS